MVFNRLISQNTCFGHFTETEDGKAERGPNFLVTAKQNAIQYSKCWSTSPGASPSANFLVTLPSPLFYTQACFRLIFYGLFLGGEQMACSGPI